MFRKPYQSRFSHSRRSSFSRPPARLNPTQYVNKAFTEIEATYIPQHQFLDFPISDQLKKNITHRGYTIPTPIQDQAILPILSGKDVVGIANTGTGKTAAFLIPLINKIIHDRTQKVLIVVPTRELAVQIRDELIAFSHFLTISSALCIGGANLERQIGELKRQPNMLIGTPGRLKDLITRRAVQLSQFKTIVLDEVDRMVDIGFIKDITQIISLLPKVRQSLFFSATISGEISTIMQAFLTNPVTVSVKKKETAQGIEQDIIKVGSKEEKFVKLNELLRQNEFKKVLVFVRTKWNAEKLSKDLFKNGFSVTAIHGNKSQNQRLRALTEFKQSRVQVMVATDIAARGLDIEMVSHVINFDEPASFDDYIHRIGRTGRANHQGKALTFVT